MATQTISDFENSLEAKRKLYTDCLNLTLALVHQNASTMEIQKNMNELHSKAVQYINLFERSIDEYGLSLYELNEDTKNRKIEDSISIVDMIIYHWTTIRMLSEKYKITCPEPSPTSYSSIQRLLKYFQKDKSTFIKQKFMDAKLPTNGFDDKAKFSGWQIGSRNLTTAQIAIGSILTIVAGVLIFSHDVFTGMQYMFSRAIFSLGLTLIGSALLESTIKLDWTIRKSFAIKAVGWLAFFIIVYYINPPSAPTP